MTTSAVKAALVALVLIETVKLKGEYLNVDGKVREFDADTAARLLAKRAAIVPPAPPAFAEPETRIIEVEKIVEREVVVNALSPAGVAFQRLKGTKAAAEFVLEQASAAIVAELQALEFRRPDGPRPELMAAFGTAFAALTKAD